MASSLGGEESDRKEWLRPGIQLTSPGQHILIIHQLALLHIATPLALHGGHIDHTAIPYDRLHRRGCGGPLAHTASVACGRRGENTERYRGGVSVDLPSSLFFARGRRAGVWSGERVVSEEAGGCDG